MLRLDITVRFRKWVKSLTPADQRKVSDALTASQKAMGDGWRVLVTGGHVETLPGDSGEGGPDAKKACWAIRPK